MKNTQLELPIPEIKKEEEGNPESIKIRGSYPEGLISGMGGLLQ